MPPKAKAILTTKGVKAKANPKAKPAPKPTAKLKAKPKAKPAHTFDSQQALKMVKQWGWGHKSATQVREDAADAHTDQLEVIQRIGASPDFAHESLRRLAGLGSSGHHASNINKIHINGC